jgi:2-haloacid dehalogenase
MAKWISFDLYDTLFDRTGLFDCVEAIANEIDGVDPKEARATFADYIADPGNVIPYVDYDLVLRDALIALDYHFGIKDRSFKRNYFHLIAALQNLPIFPDVEHTLKTLINRDYNIAIMANTADDIVMAHTTKLNLPVTLCTSEMVQTYKPDIRFFDTLQRELDFGPDHIHVAANYQTDILPALEMGWTAIWINRHDDPVPDTVEPQHQVKSVKGVLEFAK